MGRGGTSAREIGFVSLVAYGPNSDSALTMGGGVQPLKPGRAVPKSPPLQMEEQGEAPRRWLSSGPRLAGFGPSAGSDRLLAGTTTRSLPRSNVPGPEHIRSGSQGPWGHVHGTGSPPCSPEDHAISREPHLPGCLPLPQRQSSREQLGAWGLDGVQATVPCQMQQVQGGVT